MGTTAAAEMDAHLCAGGTVVTASDRAARGILRQFQHARRAEGREAWTAPTVVTWQTFVRRVWMERSSSALLPLSAVQEQSLWETIVAGHGYSAAILPGPRRTLAALAMDAHALLCAYAPRSLDRRARKGWQQEAAAFSRWLDAFDEACNEHEVISAHRLTAETIPLVRSDAGKRPPLLLAGFDRLLPIQQQFLEEWGDWRAVEPGDAAAAVHSHAAPETASELHACAAWCRSRLAADPHTRILVLSQDVAKNRGEIERAFLRHCAAGGPMQFEFSLGVPLAKTPLARSALLLLRWLDSSLAENELDWLFSTSYLAAEAGEPLALQSYLRALRDRGLQRPQWTLEAFMGQPGSASIPARWKERLISSQRQLRSAARELSPVDWAGLVPQLLTAAGWPGARALTSGEFQVKQRWDAAIDSCASLGFTGARVGWREFVANLTRIAVETLFAPESEDAPILIAGAAESAGLHADAIWFLGAHEDAWPARGDMHPLLPPDLQRQAGMPHATPQLDWDLSHAITARLLASAGEVHFSYAQQVEGVETRPSRLVAQFAGHPQALSDEWLEAPTPPPLSVALEDRAAIRYPSTPGEIPHLRGGAGLLTKQSQCPFQAFAVGRLNAATWEPAENGLTAAERGQILHAALHSIWSGPPHGITTHAELNALPNLTEFITAHVRRTLPAAVPSRIRELMPARYSELEAMRVTRLLTAWLEFEKTRIPFEVVDRETEHERTIAGLVSLRLRLDRLDKLADDTVLVIDYKTGDVKPTAWELPRPDDVQLPLYATYALDEGQEIGGLVFAKLRAGDICLTGRIADAAATIDNTLRSTSSLVRYPLSAEQIMDWRDKIAELARDYLAGKSDVDPRDAVTTCARCGLHTICRIQEREPAAAEPEGESEHN